MRQWVSEHITPTKAPMETVTEENVDNGASGCTDKEASGHASEMASFSKDLCDFKKDLQGVIKASISELKEDLNKSFKEEMTALKQDINSKLTEVKETLQSHGQAIAEVEQRVSDVEASGIVSKNVFLSLIKQQRKLQERLTDLQSRQMRNNIRIFDVDEKETEGVSIIDFVENLITTQLPLKDGVPLQIQRAHRSLAKKPAPGEKPRAIIVNFLQFEVKEAVLNLAWKNKVLVNSKQCFFEHDYPYEVMVKRRSYGEIKKMLKQKGIGFHTPFTKIRIKWSDGTKTYESAKDAAQEMTARGYPVNIPTEDPDADVEGVIQKAFPWQQVAAAGGNAQGKGL